MTVYRRIDDDTFQELQPARRVRISDLQQQRNRLQEAIDLLNGRRVNIPPTGIDDDARTVLEEHNFGIQEQVEGMQRQRATLQALIDRLRAITVRPR